MRCAPRRSAECQRCVRRAGGWRPASPTERAGPRPHGDVMRGRRVAPPRGARRPHNDRDDGEQADRHGDVQRDTEVAREPAPRPPSDEDPGGNADDDPDRDGRERLPAHAPPDLAAREADRADDRENRRRRAPTVAAIASASAATSAVTSEPASTIGPRRMPSAFTISAGRMGAGYANGMVCVSSQPGQERLQCGGRPLRVGAGCEMHADERDRLVVEPCSAGTSVNTPTPSPERSERY